MNALSVFLWLAIILTLEERKKITTTSAKLLLMFLTRGSVKEKSFATEKKRNKKPILQPHGTKTNFQEKL